MMSENEELKDRSRESNLIKDSTESLSLKRNKPERPPRLRIKTVPYYDVKLPTYEESQVKYAKLVYKLPDTNKKATTNE